MLLDLLTATCEGFEGLEVLRDAGPRAPSRSVVLAPGDVDAEEWRHLTDRLSVAARLGEGEFDAARPRSSTGPSPGVPQRSGTPMTGESILVVEDNELNLKLVRDVLEHAGYDVVEACTAEEGVARAVAEPPDLVLMDLQLPGMDGFAGLRALRADPAHADRARRWR